MNKEKIIDKLRKLPASEIKEIIKSCDKSGAFFTYNDICIIKKDLNYLKELFKIKSKLEKQLSEYNENIKKIEIKLYYAYKLNL